MKKLIILLFFFTGIAGGVAGNKNSGVKNRDKGKLEILLKNAKKNYVSFPEKSLVYGKQALEIAEQQGDKNRITDALLTIAIAFYYSKNIDSCEKYSQRILKMNLSGKSALSNNGYAANLISIANKRKGNYEKALNYAIKAMDFTRLEEDETSYACALSSTALIMSKLGKYENAVDSMYKALRLFISLNDTNNQIKVLNNLSIIYMDIGKDSLAIEYFKRVITAMENDTVSENYAAVLNNLGILFFKKQLYDSSLYYYEKAINIYNKQENAIDLAGEYQNIGNALIAKKEYNKGLSKLLMALKIYKQNHRKADIASTYLDIGNAYMGLKRFDSAQFYMYRAEKKSDSLNNYYIYNNALFTLYKYFLEREKYGKALDYYKKYVAVKDSVESVEIKNKILELKTKYETEKKESRIKELEHREREQKSENRLLWLIILLTFVVFLFIVILVFIKRKNEKKAERLRIEHLNKENELKSNRLAVHALNMMQKNKMLRELETELKSLEKQLVPDNREKIRKIKRTITKNLNSEREWNIFHRYFSNIHPSFFENLKEKYPELTTYDVRLAALIKFNLSTNEIAAALNISPGSAKTARHRLKKKLNLKPDENLDGFLGNL